MQVGGRLQSMTLDGCCFDTGPSLLLFKDKYIEVGTGAAARPRAATALGPPRTDPPPCCLPPAACS